MLPSELNEPIRVEADGSFQVLDRKNAVPTSDGNVDPINRSGGKAIDIGGGRVGQELVWGGCYSYEYLLFIDCNTGGAIRVTGEDDPDLEIGGGGVASIARIQPPHGAIALTAETTVDEVARTAEANGYGYTRDVMAEPMSMARFQRYDPFFGCKLFYPDSPGARK